MAVKRAEGRENKEDGGSRRRTGCPSAAHGYAQPLLRLGYAQNFLRLRAEGVQFFLRARRKGGLRAHPVGPFGEVILRLRLVARPLVTHSQKKEIVCAATCAVGLT